jgi:DNA-directed RNA polymerase subunit RPC12/RpoP
MNATLPACACNVCSQKIEFDPSRAGETIVCPHCGMDTLLFIPRSAPPDFGIVAQRAQKPAPVEVLQPEILTSVGVAKRKTERKTSLAGLAMELLGLILLFIWPLFPISTIIGIAFMIAGFNVSKTWRCGGCGNPLADRKVKMCPACRAILK